MSECTEWAGQETSHRLTLTSELLDQFTVLSGDTSAIHVSESAAQQKGYKARVVHGLLLGALISGVIGTKLPGDKGVLQDIKLSFRGPCYVGDEIVIRVGVAEFFESVQTLILNVRVERADGALLATGQVNSGIR